jgi:hypothetical protein
MRNLFALIGFAVVAFVVVGWYCGWYRFSVQKGEGGKAEIQTVVDTKKVTEDSTAFFQKLAQVISQSGPPSPKPRPENDPNGTKKGNGGNGNPPGGPGLGATDAGRGGTPAPFPTPPVSIPPSSGKTP